MAEMRATLPAVEGPAAVWNPADPERFRRAAGKQFVEARGDGTALVRTEGGDLVTVYPGWVVVVPEGGTPVFAAPEQAEILPR